MARRWRALVAVGAAVAIHLVAAVPALAAGGDISISVFGDLGACADASFFHPQMESAGTFVAIGAGTTFSSGIPTHVGGADGATAANGDPLRSMCVPGDPRINLAEVTYNAIATGIDYRGLPTVLSVTVDCVYTQLGSVVCTPPVKVRLPLGAT